MVRDPSQRDDAPTTEEVLNALGDEPTRAIITELSEPMTANELSDACDIPLSTMYRKLDHLTDANLLTESTEIRRSGQHATLYARGFDQITVSVDEDEQLVVTAERPADEQTADRRLEELWTQMREET